jgi:hypothetical protein
LILAATQTGVATADGIADPNLSAEQARLVFVNAGFQVGQLEMWDWLSPPVISFHVRDAARNRVLLVLAYADVAQAQRASQRMVEGYSASTWIDNLALFEASADDYQQVQMAALARGVGMSLRDLSAASLPSKRVDTEYTDLILVALEDQLTSFPAP